MSGARHQDRGALPGPLAAQVARAVERIATAGGYPERVLDVLVEEVAVLAGASVTVVLPGGGNDRILRRASPPVLRSRSRLAVPVRERGTSRVLAVLSLACRRPAALDDTRLEEVVLALAEAAAPWLVDLADREPAARLPPRGPQPPEALAPAGSLEALAPAGPPEALAPADEPGAPTLSGSLAGLRAARELTGLGLWEWRPGSDELVWSPEMFRMAGLEPGAVRPTLQAWHAAVHPEDLERARRLDVLAVSQDGGGVETFRVIGADGLERHVQSWSTVVPAGEVTVCGASVDVTHQVRTQRLLERLSETDAVTGLDNRLAFDRRMQEILARPVPGRGRAANGRAGGVDQQDGGAEVAVLLIDLDRFKLVNDSLGHQVGDRLLVEVARRIEVAVPEDAMTARMGGDEFVVVPPPGLAWLGVRRLAQALVDVLRTPYVLPDSGEMVVCPASIGVTSTAGRRVSADDLLSEADLALYRAKDSGRDRYVVYDEALRLRARRRHEAERLLRSALDDGRLVLQYQPIVDFSHGRVVGAEALVRVRPGGARPGGGRDGGPEELLGPDAFIDVAEDTGLVVELDCWVIDAAVAQVARWMGQERADRPVPWVAVNVSPRSMEHPRVVRRLLDAVQLHGVAPELLKVELTERTFLGTLPGGESALRQLLASGIPVGIDDFGTGYSALAYLPRFELDFMKIDRSFVAAVGTQDRADAVVTAIVDLAHAHGMLVTAEGIETPRQARRLREIGCDLAQGFHFGRAGPPGRIMPG